MNWSLLLSRCSPLRNVTALGLACLVPLSGRGQTTLLWNGNVNGNWDINTTANWLLGTSSVVFTNGASVLFDDRAAGSAIVNLAVPVQPAGCTVSNHTKSYIFSGSGSLNTTAGLNKLGTNRLTVKAGARLVSGGNFTVGGGAVIFDGTGGQTNTISGQTWVGNTTASAASLVLSNTIVNNTSWLAVGRGNGTTGLASAMTLYDSTQVCANLSLGYGAGVSANLQNPSLNLYGNSRLINTGGTGLNLSESSGSSATVTINGTSWIYSANRVLLGMEAGATGTLVIANSGRMTNGSYTSVGAVGVGCATLKNNSIWQNLGDFNVADTAGSQGTLYLQDNAQLVISTLYVGKAANSTGVIYQTGGTVTRNAGGDWRIGGNASGAASQYGVYDISGGVMNVGGANLQVGAYGIGFLNQTGGVVSVGGWPSIGRFAGGVGVLNVAGGTFNQTASGNSLIIGEDGAGTLNVSGTGVVSLANSLRIGNTAGASGTVNLSGGTIIAKQVYMNNAGASSTFNFNGGTLRAAPGANADFLSGLTAANILAGGAILDSGTNTITVAQDLSGSGAFTKLGSGTLVLSGTLTYSGSTFVNNGTLLVASPNPLNTVSCVLSAGAAFGVQLGMPNTQVGLISATVPLGGASLAFSFRGFGAQALAPLSVTNLALNGPATITVSGSGFTPGQYPLLRYGTRTGAGSFVLDALPAGVVAQLVTNPANQSIDLNITAAPETPPWQLKQAALMTDWAQQVDPNNPWPEYPRPQMQRTNWLNLNGVWQWQAGSADDPVPTYSLAGSILVPFCMESAISGVMEHHDRAWYKRAFTLPSTWIGQRILLHFEAVDWECEPFLNGISLGVHQGGYDPFTFDITPYLTNSGPQTLVVRVYDPTDATSGPAQPPVGKQRIDPSGIWYTACSGIWQTVWVEPVPATGIEDIHLVPDIDNQQLKVNVTVSGPTAGVTVSAAAFDGTHQVGAATGAPGADFSVPVPDSKLWSPTNPFLYDLRVSLKTNANTLDTVASYFGMRKISLGTNSGFVRMFLNNQFQFQFGPLDQGYWPDGIYTPPTDLALREDLEQSKALGFNMIRKHMKVEPRRWFYYADKLGLVVWQDMPAITAGQTVSDASKTNYEAELSRMVTTHWNSPSIIVWTVFNEGWGQYDTVRVSSNVMALDPSRLVNCASGWTYYDAGHIEDSHSYPDPSCPQNATKAVVNGEFGGVGLGITNHTWAAGWGYIGAADGADLTAKFEAFCSQVSDFVQTEGLSAAVYTQITDVETELNGLFTYDRKVLKPDLRRMQTAIVSPMGVYSNSVVVASSQNSGQSWKYTFSAPAANWNAIGFNDSAWTNGLGGFGTPGTPGAVIGTTWNTPDIWLRRTFDGTGLTAQAVSNLVLNVHHDEGAEIYINGTLAASAVGYTTSYGQLAMTPAGQAAVVAGPNNVLAVHCHQTAGGQYIDVGIDLRTVIVAPPTPPVPNWVENGTGLVGEYCSDTDLSNRVFLRTDSSVNFDWAGGSPGGGLSSSQFSVRWNARIQPRYSEVYTFHLTADDGCRLWVNGQLLIDKWYDDAGTDKTGSIMLTGGQRYDLRIEYYDNTNAASVKLAWTSASQLREVVPQGVLFPNHPPVLEPVSDQTILAGQTLVVTNSATDPDSPPQTLSFGLVNPPAGVALATDTGLLTWRPTLAQSPSTNLMTVTVADDGTPSLSATQRFTVTARPPAPPTLGACALINGSFSMAVSGEAGPDYSVYATTNLASGSANWEWLLTTNPSTLPFRYTDPVATNFSQRFYRVRLGP
jgi:autotransporter-associated beta strand protein